MDIFGASVLISQAQLHSGRIHIVFNLDRDFVVVQQPLVRDALVQVHFFSEHTEDNFLGRIQVVFLAETCPQLLK